MNADSKLDQAFSVKNLQGQPVMTSRIFDYEMSFTSKDSQLKAENSRLNESPKDPKQTPEGSFQKSEAYHINLFELIQSNIFSATQRIGNNSEKESDVFQQDRNNRNQERNSFTNLNRFSSEHFIPNRNQVPGQNAEVQPNRIPSNPQMVNNPPINMGENNDNRINLNMPPGQNEGDNVQVPINNNNVPAQDLFETINRAVTQKLTRHIAFSVVMIIIYILGCVGFAGLVSFHLLFVFLGTILGVQFFQTVKAKVSIPLTTRQKRTKYIHLLELIFLGLYLLGAALKYERLSLSIYPFTIPGFLNIVVYYFGTDSIDQSSLLGIKNQNLIKKIYLWIQLLLIALRVDHKLESWSAALSLSYYLLFGFLFYTALVFFIFLSAVFGWRRQESSYKVNVIGFGWYFMVSTYSCVWFATLLQLIKFLDDKESEGSVKTVLIESIVHSVFLLLYVAFFRQTLSNFIRLELNGLEARRNGNQNNRIERIIKFQVVDEEIPYLMIISSTFYAHMKDAFRLQNKSSVIEWIRTIKRGNNKNHLKSQQTDSDKQKRHKFNTINTNNPVKSDNHLEHKDLSHIEHREIVHPSSMVILGNRSESFYNDNGRVCYSLDDAPTYQNLKRPPSRQSQMENENDNDKMCYICTEQPPNAVYMKCGHGGVCYRCALESWKKVDKCPTCRQNIDKIAKVNIIDELKVSKIIHSTRKIVEEKVIGAR